MSLLFDRELPTFRGLGLPVRAESEVVDVEVIGRVPEALNGAYYRVGPDPTYPPFHENFHATDGNGMMVMFRFHDGHVDFRSRYVQTERLRLERAANRALFGRYRNPYTDDPSVRGRNRGTANTTMRMHAGILYALKEDSLGIAIEPATLGTLGTHDFDGAVTSKTMTAHPKIDGRTGEMIFFGSAAKGETTPDIALYVADAEGVITAEEWLTAPYASMMHDFAVTANWIIFPVMPTVSDLQRLEQGGPIYNWEPERGMYIGLMPRTGSAADVRWIHTDARWTYHIMNAYESNGTIKIDLAESDVQPFPFFHLDPARTWSPILAAPHLHTWTIDPVAETFRSERLSDLLAEFPRIDERMELGDYRHGYTLVSDSGRTPIAGSPPGPPGSMGPTNSIGHFDHQTGGVDLVYAGDQMTFEEPQFVPRSPDAPEGDGYLLAIRHRHDTRKSEIAVYDTSDLTGDPVAVARLPFRFKPGIHGGWADAADIGTR